MHRYGTHPVDTLRALESPLSPRSYFFPHCPMTPTLKPQEIPFDDPASNCFFRPNPDKPFLATPAAMATYGVDVVTCLAMLQRKAAVFDGIDYLQVFEDYAKGEPLWFIEDGPGGAITALLPSDY